jgi:hypothetical protein
MLGPSLPRVGGASRIGSLAVTRGNHPHNSYGFVVISPMFATVSPFFIEGTPHI